MNKKNIFSKFVFWVIILCIPVIAMETILRIYFAFQVGPDVILYGTPFSQHQKTLDPKGTWDRFAKESQTANYHENVMTNYSKYYPNQDRNDFDENGNVFKVVINARGFRGREIEEKKKPGVIRIITLGASSTFGFHDRENETYPYYLEQTLNEQVKPKSCTNVASFEVINLGMPHQTAENVLSLFLNEAISLQPDIVTFYEGINDASKETTVDSVKENTKQFVRGLPLAKEIFRELRYRLITFALIGNLVSRNVTEVSEEEINRFSDGKKESFLRTLSLLNEECKKRKIVFIVATQQAASEVMGRQQLKGVTYEQEAILLRDKLAKNGKIPVGGMYFLVHEILMRGVRQWAVDSSVVCVDVIKALDQDRDCLVNWVHINPKGNRIVAGAFSKEIFNVICPDVQK